MGWSGDPRPAIYFSLGSLGSADVSLMQRLIDTLGQTDYFVIVSMGPQHNELRLAPNMMGEEFLPQPAILPQVDAVITHGGNNTITESLHFGRSAPARTAQRHLAPAPSGARDGPGGRFDRNPGGALNASAALDDLVDQTVLQRLARRHEVVALGVVGDPLERLARFLGQHFFQAALHADRLAGANLDVGGLAPEPRRPQLVDQDLPVRERAALTLGPGGEQNR